MRKIIFVLSVVLLSCGCSMGPRAIKDDFNHYNKTLHHNQNQQLLMNLVRMKYHEPITFMKVGTLSTGYSYGMSSGYDGEKTYHAVPTSKVFGWNFGSNYSERPTITYNLVEGETFVKQMLKEVDAEVFVLLCRSGWSIDKLMYLMFENTGINKISEDEFKSLVTKLKRKQDNRELSFYVKNNKPVVSWIEYQIATVENFSVNKLDTKRQIEKVLEFKIRSFSDIMFELSKCVSVPNRDLDVVKNSYTDYNFSIQNGFETKRAFISVFYRGSRFFIADDDIASKNYFSLLRNLYQLQSGDIKSVQPIFTINQ